MLTLKYIEKDIFKSINAGKMASLGKCDWISMI